MLFRIILNNAKVDGEGRRYNTLKTVIFTTKILVVVGMKLE